MQESRSLTLYIFVGCILLPERSKALPVSLPVLRTITVSYISTTSTVSYISNSSSCALVGIAGGTVVHAYWGGDACCCMARVSASQMVRLT
ncbi:hypothetical protein J3F84DRAFT_374772 [Trichoderma pleuroticola]